VEREFADGETLMNEGDFGFCVWRLPIEEIAFFKRDI
jgi:hypothetical protein